VRVHATELTTPQRLRLLALARRTVLRATGASSDGVDTAAADDFAGHGAFVTLHSRGMLRGCIGTFAPSPSILGTIREMAEAAALRDPRFSAVQPDELSTVDIEISLLTPLTVVTDPATIEVGRHGICISHGYHRGVLLPQVASEHGWDREVFLDQTCVKAGLPPGTWRDPQCRIEVFEAVVFGERDT
jgi:AmmeMemoRadiSam system protein A